MKQSVRKLGKEGFTLIEVLVTLILLAVLVAAVFPVVTQQSEQGDPVRVATDLAAIRTGVNQFRLNMRPDFPGDLEDLVYQPSSVGTVDANLNRDAFSNPNKWKGPYLDVGISQSSTVPETAGLATSYGGTIVGDLKCITTDTTYVNLASADCAAGNFIAVQINGISTSEAADLEEQFDGNTTADAEGKFRHDGATTAYYILSPYF